MMVCGLGDWSPVLQQVLHWFWHVWCSNSSGTMSLDKVRRQKVWYRCSTGGSCTGCPLLADRLDPVSRWAVQTNALLHRPACCVPEACTKGGAATSAAGCIKQNQHLSWWVVLLQEGSAVCASVPCTGVTVGLSNTKHSVRCLGLLRRRLLRPCKF